MNALALLVDRRLIIKWVLISVVISAISSIIITYIFLLTMGFLLGGGFEAVRSNLLICDVNFGPDTFGGNRQCSLKEFLTDESRGFVQILLSKDGWRFYANPIIGIPTFVILLVIGFFMERHKKLSKISI